MKKKKNQRTNRNQLLSLCSFLIKLLSYELFYEFIFLFCSSFIVQWCSTEISIKLQFHTCSRSTCIRDKYHLNVSPSVWRERERERKRNASIHLRVLKFVECIILWVFWSEETTQRQRKRMEKKKAENHISSSRLLTLLFDYCSFFLLRFSFYSFNHVLLLIAVILHQRDGSLKLIQILNTSF